MTDKANQMLKEFADMVSKELNKAKVEPVLEEVVDTTPTSVVSDSVSKTLEYLSKKGPSTSLIEDFESDHQAMVATDRSSIPAKPDELEQYKMTDPLAKPDQRFVTLQEMNTHYSLFLKRIQTQMSSIGGGGEVNFRNLDDVDRSTMTPSNDNFVLEYDAASKKAQFTNKIGPIAHVEFDVTHVTSDESVGTLCWNTDDQTLNLFQPNGVTQQIGQETYAYVRNGTENTIPDGTVCMFTGAAQPDGTSRLLVGPAVSDGTFPSLYTIGVATHDIESGEDGKVTVWGKVRELDTSAFDVGNILYSDPANPGGFTNIKPTAPNNVVPVAAVLRKGTTDGEIFVRPTIEQRMYYGRFTRTTDQTIANPNEAAAVVFDTIEIANGVSFNGGSDTQVKVIESGFYQFDLSVQVTASSNKGIVYFWFRKNGVDIPRSSRSTTVTNGDTFNVSTAISISLVADDYVEIMWAKTAAGIFLDAVDATAFSPSAAAVMLNVTQIQL